MKKLFYSAAFLFACVSLSAQSYWAEGYNSNFDEWVDVLDANSNVVGERPAGWVAAPNSNWTSGANDISVTFEKATNRLGEAGKACKITTAGVASGWFTWHVNVSQQTGANASDYIASPVFIDKNDHFYYTFWAKSDVEGTEMWIGTTEMHDPKNGGEWANVPKVILSTEWRQYGFATQASIDLTIFSIQTRNNGVRYIDDIVLAYGSTLPELEDPTGIEGTVATIPFEVTGGKGFITFEGAEGTVAAFDATGRLVKQTTVTGSATQMDLNAGIYIMRLYSNGQQVTRKVVVQ